MQSSEIISLIESQIKDCDDQIEMWQKESTDVVHTMYWRFRRVALRNLLSKIDVKDRDEKEPERESWNWGNHTVKPNRPFRCDDCGAAWVDVQDGRTSKVCPKENAVEVSA